MSCWAGGTGPTRRGARRAPAPGRHHQPRPDGMPAAGWAAALPVSDGGTTVFVQLRAITTVGDRPRYLNASARLAANPKLAEYEPVEQRSRCVIVTEGIIDA